MNLPLVCGRFIKTENGSKGRFDSLSDFAVTLLSLVVAELLSKTQKQRKNKYI
jgi:hypothetical protein